MIKSISQHNIIGRGLVLVVDAKYRDEIDTGDEVVVDGKLRKIVGIECTNVLTKPIGLIVRDV